MGTLAKKIHKEARHLRVLTIDIESKPMISAHWGLWQQNIGINQILDHGGLLCFAAKWYDEKETRFHSEWDDGQDAMIRAAWEYLNEADIIVSYNGERFDMKRLNNEFLKAGLNPPKPYRQVDLFKVNKKQFDLPSRKLDYIAQQTLGDKKTPHTGMSLWLDSMDGDTKAQALMRKYNIQDVKLTEKLYDRLRPWLANTSHIGAIAGVHASCPNCGSNKLQPNGEAHANVTTYPAYICKSCGTHVRGTKKLSDVTGTRGY